MGGRGYSYRIIRKIVSNGTRIVCVENVKHRLAFEVQAFLLDTCV